MVKTGFPLLIAALFLLAFTAWADVEIRPVGNAFPTLVHRSETFVADDPSHRQFLAAFGLVDVAGGYPYSLGSPRALAQPTDKVALYAGADCRRGGGPCWTYNSSLLINDGFAAGGGHGASGSEIDITNNDVNTGDGDGYEGAIADPGYYAMAITGIGSKRATAALSVGGPGDRTLFNRGLVFLNNPVQQCSVCDYGTASTSLDIRGTHGIALDTSRAHVFAAVRLANGQNIATLRSNGAGAQLLNMGLDDVVNLAPLGNEGTRIGAPGKPIIFQGPVVAGLFTPASSRDVCQAGQIADDADFHYVCVVKNRWKRVALSSF